MPPTEVGSTYSPNSRTQLKGIAVRSPPGQDETQHRAVLGQVLPGALQRLSCPVRLS